MSAAEEILLPKKKKANVLKKCYDIDPNVYEIGVDEVGRGPLFGRVYTAAVILPKDDSFDCSMVKDSKKFTSKKKIAEAAQYIKDHALAYHISYEDEKTIDSINILQATQLSMHNSIKELIKKFNTSLSYLLLVDGNYFKPVAFLNKTTNKLVSVPHVTITGGDAIYASIAAASILAKVERDKYIAELCEEHPSLIEHYGLDTNKGYGTKKHLEGIQTHGLTIWHRSTFSTFKKSGAK